MNKEIIVPAYMDVLYKSMVTIPKGVILLRDDRKKTEWNVLIDPFKLCKYPVTQDLYLMVTGEVSINV